MRKKIAILRDSGDDLSRCMLELAQTSTYNTKLKSSVTNCSRWFSAIQDYNNTRAHRIQNHIADRGSGFGQLELSLKQLFTDLKLAKKDLKYEKGKEKEMTKIPEGKNDKKREAFHVYKEARMKSGSQHERVMKAAVEFEAEKIERLKSVLQQLSLIELNHHCRSIEFLTEAYTALESFDCASDIREYRRAMSVSCGLTPEMAKSMGKIHTSIDADRVSAPASSYNFLNDPESSDQIRSHGPATTSTSWHTADFDHGKPTIFPPKVGVTYDLNKAHQTTSFREDDLVVPDEEDEEEYSGYNFRSWTYDDTTNYV